MAPIAKENDTLIDSPESSARSSAGASAPSDNAIKQQPVALEVPVSVNGARTIEGSAKREPFSETTKTVLIFGSGAVIRLASSVAPGQLLFLTNEKTKKEVVCQVVVRDVVVRHGEVTLDAPVPAPGVADKRTFG